MGKDIGGKCLEPAGRGIPVGRILVNSFKGFCPMLNHIKGDGIRQVFREKLLISHSLNLVFLGTVHEFLKT